MTALSFKSWHLSWNYPKENQMRKKEVEESVKQLHKRISVIDSFMKLLVTIVVVHGLMCITASYVMAFMGYADALENLSSTMASQIVAPVVTYGVTKMVENVSKYNDWIEKYFFWKLGMPGGVERSKEEEKTEEEEAFG